MSKHLFIVAGAWLAGLTAGFAEEEAAGHWAFQPITRPPVPEVRDPAWVAHPIDAFILERLEAENLRPSPEAAPTTLLRRLHLDLTGLLPAPEEAENFAAAWKRNPDAAYAAKVQELLDSPHFGERWARHWLDLARYADSDGYLGDDIRPFAWVYRDWVIRSINEDQPFDEFTAEQLAGDLIPGATTAQKIATGFLRNNLRNTEAGADRELDRTKQVIDRVATFGASWLGLTLACAECHDHKHDPVSQKEFYQFYAFFNNTNDLDMPLPGGSEAAKAQTLEERPAKDHRATFVHLRGDYQAPGDPITAGTPAVMHPLLSTAAAPNRLQLAHWLFEEGNPLTARVAVNQIWQHLFGIGLVATPDDFGIHGDPPSHPELVDWLATEFRRLGWSRKELIRAIVNSNAYRQSSVNTSPDLPNHLLWRQNSYRLSAEIVRDVHLSASGLLSTRVGGPGIYPPLPAFVSEVGRSVKWPVSEGGDRYRRGMYIVLKRTVLYPMLTAFDAPDTSAACGRRDRTNTPMQALTLLNDPVFFECAEVLGRRQFQKHGADSPAAIREMARICLSREATPQELAALMAAHGDLRAASTPELATIATARILLNLDEFVTRD